MTVKLGENLRKLRKERGMTQEQLAEALGVTVGAVYKWESGRSTPEAAVLMELADMFGVSVDALLGFKLRSSAVVDVVERIRELQRKKDYAAAVEEAETALKRYPNDFRVVFRSGSMYEHLGLENYEEATMLRAVELLEQAILLLPQNTDLEVCEASISTQIALCYLLMGQTEKGTELLKKYNIMGVNDSLIGYNIAESSLGNREEAVPYLDKGFLHSFSGMVHCVGGYSTIYVNRGDYKAALEVLQWFIGYLESVRAENVEVSYVDKLCALYYAICGNLLYLCDRKEEGRQSLRKGYELARRFDAAPTYRLDTIKFVISTDQLSSASDDMGRTAIEAIDKALRADGDCAGEILELWEELVQNSGESTDA